MALPEIRTHSGGLGESVSLCIRIMHDVAFQGSTCYLFGGRNDDTACNLLFTFCTKTHTWARPQVSGDIPGERDGHSAAIIGQHMYVFGGYEVKIAE